MAAIVLSWLLLFADDGVRAGITELIAEAAADLATENPAGFLKRFDKAMPGYARLESDIRAIVRLADLQSGAEIRDLRDLGNGRHEAVIDWYLEFRPREGSQILPTTRRRELLKAVFVLQGKRWRITSLDPAGFFTPPDLAK
jgi:hypothetical protein